MKKISLLVASLLVMVTLSAQSFTQGPQSKDLNYNMAANAIIVGEDAESIYLVTYETGSFVGNFKAKDIKVMVVDHNLKERNSFVLDDTKDNYIVAAAKEGDLVMVLAYEFESRELKLTRHCVNVASMQQVQQPETLLTLSGKECYTWYKWSSNHQYFGFVAGLMTPKKQELSMTEILFDSNLRPVWNQSYPINAVSDVAVGNDGTIATLGYRSEESCTRFLFGSITAQGGRQFDLQYNYFVDPIKACLIDYRDGLYVMGGIVMASDTPVNDECFDRYFGLVYNSRTGQMFGKANTFTLEEVNVLGDQESDKRQRHLYADALTLGCQQPTSYGGALTIQRKYLLQKRDANGIWYYIYFQTGLLAMGVDTLGNVLWHCPVRSNVVSNECAAFADCAAFVENDHYYLLQSESKKSPETYDNSEPFKTALYPKGAQRLGCYDIAPDGRVSKTLIPLEEKGILCHHISKVGNKYLGILSLNNKASIYSLEIK